MLEPEAFAKRLGHAFSNPDLLVQALTHRSLGSGHNERLEFLGDALLGVVIAAELFARHPHATEGQLTRMRATLVRRETLASLAREHELGDYLRLGLGELKSGGYRRDSVLADTLEAVFGAFYLDTDFEHAQALMLALYATRLDALSDAQFLKDPKTRLQEFLQGRGEPLPEYTVIEVVGKDHDCHYTVACRVARLDAAVIGTGSSRRKAEQDAASGMIDNLSGEMT